MCAANLGGEREGGKERAREPERERKREGSIVNFVARKGLN
jgi:hypothetical protein